MRDRPAITIPDDHDMYQGNIWGERRPQGRGQRQFGRIYHAARLGQHGQRTQTSHLPDPYDPTPVQQGIGVYYCDLVYGRVSFAVLEDRKFKSGPERRRWRD